MDIKLNTTKEIWKFLRYLQATENLEEVRTICASVELTGELAQDFWDWVDPESLEAPCVTPDEKEEEEEPVLLDSGCTFEDISKDTHCTPPEKLHRGKEPPKKSSGKKWLPHEISLLKEKVKDDRPPETIQKFLPTRSIPAIERRVHGKHKKVWNEKLETYVKTK
jgi:hypothetical protein